MDHLPNKESFCRGIQVKTVVLYKVLITALLTSSLVAEAPSAQESAIDMIRGCQFLLEMLSLTK